MAQGRQRLGMLIICVAVFTVAGGYGLLHYLTYHATAFDLGFFDNVVEHPWTTSFLAYPFLGLHWEPILVVPALLDRITPTPIWLLLIQTLALAAAPAAAAWLAGAWLPESRHAPIAAALATALSPFLARAAAYDFHPEALTPLLALLALGAAARGRLRLCLVCCAALLLVKEDAALVVLGIGLVVWRVERQRLGIAIALGGAFAFAILVTVVMPAVRGGAPDVLATRYAYLGGSTPAELALGALLHPDRVAAHLWAAPARSGMLIALLPLALLPLLGGWAMVAAIPVLLVALLSSTGQQQGLLSQYGLEVLPLLLAAAILGWRRVDRWQATRLRSASVSPGWLMAAAALAAYIALSPLPGGRVFDAAEVSGLERHDAVERLLRGIPGDVAVSASAGLVAHVSARTAVYQYPNGLGAPWVVIDPKDFSGGDAGERERLAALGYRVVGAAAGVTAWRRDGGATP